MSETDSLYGRFKQEITLLKQSQFARTVGESLVVRIASLGLGMATSIIIARMLGPEGRGEFAIASTVTMLGIQFGNLGIPQANTYWAATDKARVPTLLGNSLLFGCLAGLFAGGFAYVFLTMRPDFCAVSPLMLALACAGMLVILMGNLLQNLILGMQLYRINNTYDLSQRILMIVLFLPIALTGFRTSNIYYGIWIASQIFPIFFLFVHVRKSAGGPQTSKEVFRDSLRYGIRSYLCCILYYIGTRANLLLGQYYLTKEEIGLYAIALSLSDLVGLVPTTVSTILFPKLSSKAIESRWMLLQMTSIRLIGIVTLMLTTACLFIHPCISILYGDIYLPASAIFYAMTPGIFFMALSSLYSSYLASNELPWALVGLNLACCVLGIVLSIAFMGKYRAEALAFAASSTAIVHCIGTYFIARSKPVSAL